MKRDPASDCRVATCTSIFICCWGDSLSRGGARVPLAPHERKHTEEWERGRWKWVWGTNRCFYLLAEWKWSVTLSCSPEEWRLWPAGFCTGPTLNTGGKSPGHRHQFIIASECVCVFVASAKYPIKTGFLWLISAILSTRWSSIKHSGEVVGNTYSIMEGWDLNLFFVSKSNV